MGVDEFSLIARIAARTSSRADIALGIGDDAALLVVPDGHQLVVTTDTLNSGIHFPPETPAADVGWKALAANLSDLAAMGAQPAWCTLAMTLPDADAGWVDAFADGLFALADAHGMAVVGGDTTRGPLAVSITAMGWVPMGQALRRDGARVGDDIWVTGVPAEAAAGYFLWQRGQLRVDAPDVFQRYGALARRWLRPEPRVKAGLALRGLATACADISDGLCADLGHICQRSGVAARLELASMPRSPELAAWLPEQELLAAQLTGGEAYELCFTAPPALRSRVQTALHAVGVAGTRVGTMAEGRGVSVRAVDGLECTPSHPGYNHFVR